MRTFGLQTYTVRKLIKEDLDFTLHELKSMKLTTLECARMPIDQMSINSLKKYRMKVISLQLTLNKIQRKYNEILHFCKETGNNNVVISVLPIWARIPLIGPRLFTSKVNKLSSKYQKEGIRICFHHHAYEMKKTQKNFYLDRYLKNLHPHVGLIIDTYWITLMGQDPLDIYKRYIDRVQGIHLRDYQKSGQDIEIGQGTIDFKTFIQKLNTNVYTVIEQNAKDPLISIQQSLNYLEENI
ncbi:MAG: sugar phosphate isomerase/epimerase [Acholeplasmataceae bacterium]